MLGYPNADSLPGPGDLRIPDAPCVRVERGPDAESAGLTIEKFDVGKFPPDPTGPEVEEWYWYSLLSDGREMGGRWWTGVTVTDKSELMRALGRRCAEDSLTRVNEGGYGPWCDIHDQTWNLCGGRADEPPFDEEPL